MSVIEKLTNDAVANAEVLQSLDTQGDDFGIFRDVDFLLMCPSREKAELVAGFLNDYAFGDAHSSAATPASVVTPLNKPSPPRHVLRDPCDAHRLHFDIPFLPAPRRAGPPITR